MPISRYQDRSRAEPLKQMVLQKGRCGYQESLNLPMEQSGPVSVNVEVYGDLKDFPETKEKLNQLSLEAKSAEERFSKAKNESIPQDDVNAANDRLRALEIEKIHAVGSHERTKEICNMKIEFNQSELKKVKEKSDGINKQNASEVDELNDLKLQLEVNKDLFDNLREIIKVMNFKGDVIDQFMDLSSSEKDPRKNLRKKKR